jgi:DNA-binding NarL/FixJ family response regulator
LVEHQASFRDSLQTLLSTQFDFNLVGVGKDAYDAIELAEQWKPDVVLLDGGLPLLNKMTALASLHSRAPSSAIILFDAEMDDETIKNAVLCGVTGLVLRRSVFEELNSAIRNVGAGNSYTSPDITRKTFSMLSELVRKTEGEGFNRTVEGGGRRLEIRRRELLVAGLVGEGRSNRQIADELDLKIGTVRNYISLILKKTGLRDRTQLALYAVEEGLSRQARRPAPQTEET